MTRGALLAFSGRSLTLLHSLHRQGAFLFASTQENNSKRTSARKWSVAEAWSQKECKMPTPSYDMHFDYGDHA